MKKAQMIIVAQKLGVQVFKSWTKAKLKQAIDGRRRELLDRLDVAEYHHEKFSRAYFWTPPSNSSQRRKMEDLNSFDMSIEFDGCRYEYESDVNVSCRNVYYTGRFMLNGEKKNLRVWKKLRTSILATQLIG